MEQNSGARSISKFCVAHDISRSLFYILKKKNEAPATMLVGRRRLITPESEAAWREQRTAQTRAAESES